MKRGDKYVIILIIIISLALFAYKFFSSEEGERIVRIEIDGELYEEIKITDDMQETELLLDTNYGKNVIHIDEKGVYVSDANCRDHICQNQGRISSIGEMIVCVPNRIFIEIKSDNGGGIDGISQ